MQVFTHGIGGAKDLPIPAGYAIVGGAVALTVSFVVLAVAWRSSRYDVPGGDRVAPAWLSRLVDGRWLAGLLRVVGLLLFGYLAWAAVAGPDLVTNPVFGVLYVLLWVGLVPASVLFGPVVRALSPFRTLHWAFSRATGGRPEDGIATLPPWVGYWPGALGLFAFVWLELVFPESTYLSPVRLWIAVYLAVVLVGGAVFGSAWFERADPFEVFSTLVGHLSVVGRREDGTLVLASPLRNLARLRPQPGLVGVVAVLFGSTAFDSFKDSNRWLQFVQTVGERATTVNLVALVVFCAVVGLTFAAATTVTGVRPDIPRRPLPNRFAHSVLPIVVGYVVAHYLSYFLEVGQQTLIQLSDPMGTGANLLGTANWSVSYWISSHPTFLAVVKVLAVVAGHVVGVVAAYDRAISLLPKRHQLTGQLPLLVVMVSYTVTGLSLLFGA